MVCAKEVELNRLPRSLSYAMRVARLLMFLMTPGVSLSLWSKSGILYREVRVLDFLSKLYDRVYILTYGGFEDLRHRSVLPSNVDVLFNNVGNCLAYGFLAPFVYRCMFRKFGIIVCRTVQLAGCFVGLLLKLFYGARLVLRQGYQYSKFLRSRRAFHKYVFAQILELFAYWFADVVITTSENDREYIVRRYRVNRRKVHVIPNWVDVEAFKPMPGVPKERGRVVFVGRLEHQKNLHALIDAVKDLPDVKLYVIGDGSLRKELERKVANEHVDNVVFLGVVPHEKMPYELNRSEIFVLPSLWEGHPKTLIEAMACGLPVVGTDVEGIREVLVDGYNGLLCKPNAKSIREALVKLLNDSELRRELGENARKFVVENYSLEKVMERELALHLWVIKSRGGMV